MKITNLKFEDLPLYVNQHLCFLEPTNLKFMIASFTFLMLDLGVLPLLYPKVDLVWYVNLPLLIFIHLWAIRLLVKNPYTIQNESILYIGSTGFVGTICYLFVSHKIAYFQIGITSASYYIISTVALIFIIGYLVYYQIDKYSNISKSADKKYGYGKFWAAAIPVFPGLGYIIFHVTKESEQIMFSIFLGFSLFFCLMFAYFSAKYFHKYLFMKANPQYVKLQKPIKSERRKFEEKKLVIK
jgi:hypothetical protein